MERTQIHLSCAPFSLFYFIYNLIPSVIACLDKNLISVVIFMPLIAHSQLLESQWRVEEQCQYYEPGIDVAYNKEGILKFLGKLLCFSRLFQYQSFVLLGVEFSQGCS